MSNETSNPIRMAFRAEGQFVNCYLAQTGTMEGAQLMGSIGRGILERDKTIWDDFKKLMERAIINASIDAFGVAPLSFEEEPAPPHEKSGNA